MTQTIAIHRTFEAVADRAPLPIQIQQTTNPERVIRFVASDESVDRAGDVILQSGWDFSEYLRNPIVTEFHDNTAWPIGKAIALGVVDSRLMIDCEFDPPDVDEEADKVYRKIQHGSIRAGSVGFIPIERDVRTAPRRPELFAAHKGAERIFVKSKLIEWTVCPLPMNPNALAASLQRRYEDADTEQCDVPARDNPANDEAATLAEVAALWSIERRLARIEEGLRGV